MIISIKVTDEAIEYIQNKTALGPLAAGEFAQEVVNLCKISGSETPKYQEERELLWGIDDLIERYKNDETFVSHVSPLAFSLERSLRQFIDILEEEERRKEEDTLFKTAHSLMRFYAENGSKAFRSRFGSLEILEACRKIIEEGEGNPHPWEHEK